MTKLQLYFEYYLEHHSPKNTSWYEKISKAFKVMSAIKAGLPSAEDFNVSADKKALLENSFAESTKGVKQISSIESFLEIFVFKQDNGIGNVKQGVVWSTTDNPHRAVILGRANPERIYEILSSTNVEEVDNNVKDLLTLQNDRQHPAVQNRLMRALFPNNFAGPDAEEFLNRLIKTIGNKFGINIAGKTILEKHQNLCIEIETDDPIARQIFTWELFYLLENEVSLKKAVCFYGAPGTGKTYNSSREAKKLIDAHRIIMGRSIGENYSIKTVQFHPSYSYEDFMEGIRPSNEGRLKLFNGSFKQFCKDHGSCEIELYTTTKFLSKPEFEKLEFDFSRIKVNELDQSEKDVLGLSEENYPEELTIQDVIEPAFFIIDEINRAELSKVFGELMYSLEYRGYRGKIKTQYSHLCETQDAPASFLWEDEQNWFFIPQNIYIISTMNNIDRSVDAFDFALRRRFMWKEVEPNYHVITKLLEGKEWRGWGSEISERLKSLNDLIKNDDILDKNYCIGQSYVLELLKLKPERFDTCNDACEFIWKGFIAPLLEEYLKGLGNEQKSREKIESFKAAFLR